MLAALGALTTPTGYLAVLPAEGVALVFILSILIDLWGLGGPRLSWFFDRLAFLGWVTVWAAGFEGTGLTGTVTGVISGFFEAIANISNAPLARGFIRVWPFIIGMLVTGVVIGCLVPNRIKVLGKLSHLEFHHLRVAKTALVTTGVGRGPSPGAASPAGKSTMRRIFSGDINLGMVIAAFLLVAIGPMLNGGMGGVMDWMTMSCVRVNAAWLMPVLRWAALA